MKRYSPSRLAAGLLLLLSGGALASDYVIDTKGAHAFIQFHIKHLGYSWLTGRFNTFGGRFSYDEADPGAARVEVTIDTASVDSNHAERDKHLRDEDLLDVKQFPQARFVSTAYHDTGDGRGELVGELTLHGVTRPITIAVSCACFRPNAVIELFRQKKITNCVTEYPMRYVPKVTPV